MIGSPRRFWSEQNPVGRMYLPTDPYDLDAVADVLLGRSDVWCAESSNHEAGHRELDITQPLST